MGVQEDIFVSFLQSLGDDIPEKVIKSLKVLLISQEIVSKDDILNILKEGEQNIDRDI